MTKLGVLGEFSSTSVTEDSPWQNLLFHALARDEDIISPPFFAGALATKSAETLLTEICTPRAFYSHSKSVTDIGNNPHA